ncbi:MAG: cytochrome C oxidase subunit IV family protein [Phycisphaerales bacterium JB065]
MSHDHDHDHDHDRATENEGLMPNLHHEEDDHHGHHVHVTPLLPMVLVFGALLCLTALTLWTAKAEYFYVSNSVNLVVALVIAGIKGLLVAGFFMHLVYDKAMNTVIVVATLFAVVLFLTLTLVDLSTQDIVDKTEKGEIAIGGSVQITLDEDGNRQVGRGVYSPFWSDNPGLSIVELARMDPENTKIRESHHHDDHGHAEEHASRNPRAILPEGEHHDEHPAADDHAGGH